MGMLVSAIPFMENSITFRARKLGERRGGAPTPGFLRGPPAIRATAALRSRVFLHALMYKMEGHLSHRVGQLEGLLVVAYKLVEVLEDIIAGTAAVASRHRAPIMKPRAVRLHEGKGRKIDRNRLGKVYYWFRGRRLGLAVEGAPDLAWPTLRAGLWGCGG